VTKAPLLSPPLPSARPIPTTSFDPWWTQELSSYGKPFLSHRTLVRSSCSIDFQYFRPFDKNRPGETFSLKKEESKEKQPDRGCGPVYPPLVDKSRSPPTRKDYQKRRRKCENFFAGEYENIGFPKTGTPGRGPGGDGRLVVLRGLYHTP